MNPGVWIAAHKTAALGGGAVAIGGYALYRKSKSASTAATTTATSADGTTATVPSDAGSAYDSSSADVYNSLEGQLGQLQSQLAGITATSTPTPITGQQSPGPAPVKTSPAPKTTPAQAAQPAYAALTSAAAVNSDITNGIKLYQSGTEADAWDLANGTPKGQSLVAASGYYQLSPAAAKALASTGGKVYVQG